MVKAKEKKDKMHDSGRKRRQKGRGTVCGIFEKSYISALPDVDSEIPREEEKISVRKKPKEEGEHELALLRGNKGKQDQRPQITCQRFRSLPSDKSKDWGKKGVEKKEGGITQKGGGKKKKKKKWWNPIDAETFRNLQNKEGR